LTVKHFPEEPEITTFTAAATQIGLQRGVVTRPAPPVSWPPGFSGGDLTALALVLLRREQPESRSKSSAHPSPTELDAHEGPVYIADENAIYLTTLPRPGADRSQPCALGGSWRESERPGAMGPKALPTTACAHLL